MNQQDFIERVGRIEDHLQYQYEKIKEIRDSRQNFNFGYAFDIISIDYQMRLGRVSLEFKRYEEARSHFSLAHEQVMNMQDGKKKEINLNRIANELNKILLNHFHIFKTQHS